MEIRRVVGVVVGACGVVAIIVALARIFFSGNLDINFGQITLLLAGLALTWLGLLLIGRRRRQLFY